VVSVGPYPLWNVVPGQWSITRASACGEAVLDVFVDHLFRHLDDAFATERFEDPTRRAIGLRRESQMGTYLR